MSPKPQPATAKRRAARSDGLRNRRHVLEAAAEAFATAGPGASVNDIARNASVGIGTLYRHFPTKDDLLAEVVKTRLSDLHDVALALLAEDGDDDAGALLVRWMQATSDHVSHFTAVSAWFAHALGKNPQLRALHDQVLADGELLLRAAQQAGHARESVTIEDLTAAIVALSVPAPEDPARRGRLLALLANGLLRTPGYIARASPEPDRRSTASPEKENTP